MRASYILYAVTPWFVVRGLCLALIYPSSLFSSLDSFWRLSAVCDNLKLELIMYCPYSDNLSPSTETSIQIFRSSWWFEAWTSQVCFLFASLVSVNAGPVKYLPVCRDPMQIPAACDSNKTRFLWFHYPTPFACCRTCLRVELSCVAFASSRLWWHTDSYMQ